MSMSYNMKTGFLAAMVGLAVLTSCGSKQQRQAPSAVYKTMKVAAKGPPFSPGCHPDML